MDDRRRIVIRDPRLRRFRNSLRAVIEEAAMKKLNNLIDRVKELSHDEHGNYIYNLPDNIRRQIRSLYREEEAINLALEESVVCCSLCHSLDRDVEYVQKFESWFCIKCAKIY